MNKIMKIFGGIVVSFLTINTGAQASTETVEDIDNRVTQLAQLAVEDYKKHMQLAENFAKVSPADPMTSFKVLGIFKDFESIRVATLYQNLGFNPLTLKLQDGITEASSGTNRWYPLAFQMSGQRETLKGSISSTAASPDLKVLPTYLSEGEDLFKRAGIPEKICERIAEKLDALERQSLTSTVSIDLLTISKAYEVKVLRWDMFQISFLSSHPLIRIMLKVKSDEIVSLTTKCKSGALPFVYNNKSFSTSEIAEITNAQPPLKKRKMSHSV